MVRGAEKEWPAGNDIEEERMENRNALAGATCLLVAGVLDTLKWLPLREDRPEARERMDAAIGQLQVLLEMGDKAAAELNASEAA